MALNLLSGVVFFALQLAINFFLAPFILRTLGEEAYGFLTLANSLIAYAYILTALINSLAGRFVATSYHQNDLLGANSFYSSALIANAFFSFIIAIISGVFIIYLQSFLQVSDELIFDVKLCFALYALNFIIGLFNGVLGISAFVKNKVYLISLRRAFSSLIFAFFVLVLYYFYAPLITYAALAALIASVFVLFSSLIISKRLNTGLEFAIRLFSWNKIKQLCVAGAFSSFTMLSQSILNSVDLLLCNIFLNPASMGVLAIAKAVVLFMFSFIGTAASSFLPRFVEYYSKNNIPALINEIIFSSKVLCFLATAPISVFVVFCKDFYALWLPFKNADEIGFIANLALIAALPAIIMSCMYPLLSINIAANKQKNAAIATLIMALVTALAQFVALKYFGLGLLAIFVIASFTYCAKLIFFDIFNAAFILNINAFSFVPLFLKNLALFALNIALLYLIKMQIFLINSWAKLIIFGFLFMAFSYALSYFILFNKYEKDIFKNKIRGYLKR